MIQLKKNFKKMGERFTQLYKDDEIVIYHTTFPSVEIFKYRIHKPNNMVADEFEWYPSSENFGTWAWCATSRLQFERILKDHFALSDEKYEICVGVCPF